MSPLAFACLSSLLTLRQTPPSSPPETSIPVVHCRPSGLLEQIKPLVDGLGDIRMHADDHRGLLLLQASKSELAQVKSFVEMFDVHPAELRMHLKVSSPSDHTVKWTFTDVANNRAWSMTDSELNIELRIVPRINDDGTFTLRIESAYNGTRGSFVIRISADEKLYIWPGYALATAKSMKNPDSLMTKDLRETQDKCVPEIQLTLEE